jgi:hypothetical protein
MLNKLSSKNIKDNIIKLETTSVCASSLACMVLLLEWSLKGYKIFEKGLQKFVLNLV